MIVQIFVAQTQTVETLAKQLAHGVFTTGNSPRIGQHTRQRARQPQTPIHLTQQAKAEDYEAAKQQERDRIQGALEGRPARVEGLRDVRGVVPVPLEMTIEGEAGAYDRSPLSRVG